MYYFFKKMQGEIRLIFLKNLVKNLSNQDQITYKTKCNLQDKSDYIHAKVYKKYLHFWK